MLNFLNLKIESFGLDFSDSSLKIIKLEKKRGGLKLASFGEAFIRPGVIKNGEIKNKEILVKTIKKALLEVIGEKIKIKNVIVSLPEEKSFIEVIQMPKMQEEDLRSAVIYEAENYIPMPIDEVCLDSQIVPATSGVLDHEDVLIAAFPKKTINFYIECLKESGLKPIVFETESLATSRALIKDEISDGPILIIDFGATRTNFIIFSGHSVRFTFSLPFYQQKLTEDIARSMKIDLVSAEKLKSKHGLFLKKSEEGQEIYYVLNNSLMGLVDQIKKYLDYYYTHIFHEHLPGNKRIIKKVLLCGGGSDLKGLDDFFSCELSLPIEFADPWVNVLSAEKKENAGISPKESLKYVTAIGLAIRGIKNQ
ncbi:MAG: type IV pilus assembly protein PilM [Candidatus Nealsonbacteria bacterium]|nr:type IV pilus assembly protein PilM [Candidatus Nealsonbacteria bacterium]